MQNWNQQCREWSRTSAPLKSMENWFEGEGKASAQSYVYRIKGFGQGHIESKRNAACTRRKKLWKLSGQCIPESLCFIYERERTGIKPKRFVMYGEGPNGNSCEQIRWTCLETLLQLFSAYVPTARELESDAMREPWNAPGSIWNTHSWHSWLHWMVWVK